MPGAYCTMSPAASAPLVVAHSSCSTACRRASGEPAARPRGAPAPDQARAGCMLDVRPAASAAFTSCDVGHARTGARGMLLWVAAPGPTQPCRGGWGGRRGRRTVPARAWRGCWPAAWRCGGRRPGTARRRAGAGCWRRGWSGPRRPTACSASAVWARTVSEQAASGRCGTWEEDLVREATAVNCAHLVLEQGQQRLQRARLLQVLHRERVRLDHLHRVLAVQVHVRRR